uniref:Photosystem II reaction center protein Y n=1 Tax=Haptophyceae sp. NIES-3900 TaxID=2748608 RepID=A0A7R6WF07_9EUKA|nr:photosystem II protein Y [Haptophyceae sp. NIES-3900]
MDSRLFIVLLPVGAAATWAFFNVGRLALQQLNRTRNS